MILNYFQTQVKRASCGLHIFHNCEVNDQITIEGVDYDITLQNGHSYDGNDYSRPSNSFDFYTEYADKKLADFWNMYEVEVENFDSDKLKKYGFKTAKEALDFYQSVHNEIDSLISLADDLFDENEDLQKITELIEDVYSQYAGDLNFDLATNENSEEKIIEILEGIKADLAKEEV